MKKIIDLGLCLMLLLVLVFGSVLLSLSVVNVALAVDMPDAPVTQDTVTTGKEEDDNDDNEGDEDNDQPDNLPDLKDAPVTTETITSGENGGSKEDKSNGNPAPIQDCTNPIEADADIELGIDNCVYAPAGDQPVIDYDKAYRQGGEIENNIVISPRQACPKNQERALFALTCMPIAPTQDCPNPIEADADIDNTFDNDCITSSGDRSVAAP